MDGARQIPLVFDTGTKKVIMGDGNDYEPFGLSPFTGADTSVVTAVSDPVTGGLEIKVDGSQVVYHVTPEQFGAMGDGVSDDTSAFEKFNDYAKVKDGLVRLVCTQGSTYNYTNPYWVCDIANLEIYGNGCTFVNTTYIGPDNTHIVHSTGFSKNKLGGYYSCVDSALVATTTPGSYQAQCVVAPDAGTFTSGEIVCLGSEDTYFSSQPPSLRNFEFLEVESVNVTTGVVVFTTPISMSHRSDAPYVSYSNNPPGGRAALYKIEQASKWGIRHFVRDCTFTLRDLSLTGGAESNVMSGKYVRYLNVVSDRFLPTVAGNVVIDACLCKSGVELDKSIGSVEITSSTIEGSLGGGSGVAKLHVTDCDLLGGYSICCKSIKIHNSRVFGEATLRTSTGRTRQFDVSNGAHQYTPDLSSVTEQTAKVTVGSDGVLYDSATGVLTVPLTSSALIRFFSGAEIGSQVVGVTTESGSDFATTLSGIVSDVYGGNAVAYIKVPFNETITNQTLWINWEPDEVNIVTRNGHSNVSKDSIRFPRKTFKQSVTLTGNGTVLENTPLNGVLYSIKVTVLKAYSGAAAGNVTVELSTSKPVFQGAFSRKVNLKTLGSRVATQIGHCGWTATGGEAAGAVISSDRSTSFVSAFYLYVSGMSGTETAGQLPVVEVEFELI